MARSAHLAIFRSAVLAAPAANTHPHSSSAPSATAASLCTATLALSAAASAPLRSRRALEGDRHVFWNGVEVESQADVIPKGNDKFRSMDWPPRRHVTPSAPTAPTAREPIANESAVGPGCVKT